MLENAFQKDLIKELKLIFPGCIVLKNDPNYLQGVPDLLILYQDLWATLEVKKSASERPRPNQVYYVDQMDSMSFSAFIFPENKDEVLNDLQQTFRSRR